MALQLAVTDSGTGVSMAECYVKVTGLRTWGDSRVEFDIGCYVTQAARASDKAPVARRTIIIENFDHADQKSVKKKCYEYLKTLPEFAGAQDV